MFDLSEWLAYLEVDWLLIVSLNAFEATKELDSP